MLIPVNFHAEPKEMKEITLNAQSSGEAWMSLVHTLMCHRKGGDNEGFCKNAIESLLKKLRHNGEELESLMTVITTAGVQPSKCVTILRTLDGRLQIAGRKGFPHVIYARIWRWPDLQKNELRHLKCCQFAFDLKCDYVCINPYHYERVVSSDIEPFLIDVPSLMQQSQVQIGSPESVLYISRRIERGASSETGVGVSGCASYIDIDRTMTHIIQPNRSPQSKTKNPQQDHPTFQPCHPSPDSTSDDNWGELSCLNGVESHANSVSINMPVDRHSNVSTVGPSTYGLGLYSLNSKDARSATTIQGQTTNQPYGITTHPECAIQSINSNALKALSEKSQRSSVTQVHQSGLSITPTMDCSNVGISPQWTAANILEHTQEMQAPDNRFLNTVLRCRHDEIDVRFVSLMTTLPALDHWCSVEYFELDNHVGETFKVRKGCPIVSIDGYVNPTEEHRFCLGALSNVQRTEQSEKVRLHIGKGVTLYLRSEGDVWLACQSNHSVFLQSYHLDITSGLAPGTYIHKIHPSAYIKVFDLQQCYTQMREQIVVAQQAAMSQAAAVAGHVTSSTSVVQNLNAMAGIGVDDLRRFCILRLSFVKGWGPDYPRPSIKDTPCWIEIHIHRALQLLDDILHTTPMNVTRIIE